MNGKGHTVDVAYHFCRGPNLHKIQQQPGLWSRIQANNISRSQNGEGIYTFNNPLSSSYGKNARNVEEVQDNVCLKDNSMHSTAGSTCLSEACGFG